MAGVISCASWFPTVPAARPLTKKVTDAIPILSAAAAFTGTENVPSAIAWPSIGTATATSGAVSGRAVMIASLKSV